MIRFVIGAHSTEPDVPVIEIWEGERVLGCLYPGTPNHRDARLWLHSRQIIRVEHAGESVTVDFTDG